MKYRSMTRCVFPEDSELEMVTHIFVESIIVDPDPNILVAKTNGSRLLMPWFTQYSVFPKSENAPFPGQMINFTDFKQLTASVILCSSK